MRTAFCFIFFLISCNNDVEYVPPLEHKHLVEMLIDMHTAEASLSRIPKAKVDSTRVLYLNQILNKYQLEESGHIQLMDHLKKDPQRLSDLYSEVFDSIEARGAGLEPNI